MEVGLNNCQSTVFSGLLRSEQKLLPAPKTSIDNENSTIGVDVFTLEHGDFPVSHVGFRGWVFPRKFDSLSPEGFDTSQKESSFPTIQLFLGAFAVYITSGV